MGTQITEYSPIEATLADLSQRFKGVVFDVRTTQGMALAHGRVELERSTDMRRNVRRRHRRRAQGTAMSDLVARYEAAMSSGNLAEFLLSHAKLWPFIKAALEAAEEMEGIRGHQRTVLGPCFSHCSMCAAQFKFRAAMGGGG